MCVLFYSRLLLSSYPTDGLVLCGGRFQSDSWLESFWCRTKENVAPFSSRYVSLIFSNPRWCCWWWCFNLCVSSIDITCIALDMTLWFHTIQYPIPYSVSALGSRKKKNSFVFLILNKPLMKGWGSEYLHRYYPKRVVQVD